LEQSDCQRIAGHPILRCVNVLRDSARVADVHAVRKVVPIRRIPAGKNRERVGSFDTVFNQRAKERRSLPRS